MAFVRQSIIYGKSGEKLVFDSPDGRPSAVTSVEVFDYDDSDDNALSGVTTGSASVQDGSTTLTAAAGFGQSDARLLSLTDATDFDVGRVYLIENEDNRREYFEATEVDRTNEAIYTRAPLRNAFPTSGTTVVNTRMQISLDSSWVGDENNITGTAAGASPGYRVRWEYAANLPTGEAIVAVHYSYFDLVRNDVNHSVLPSDMEVLVPSWLVSLPQYHQKDRGAGLVDEAYKQVSIDLAQEGIHEDQTRWPDLVNELTKRKAVVLWAEARAMMGGDQDAVEIARDAYKERWLQLVRGPSEARIPIAGEEGGVESASLVGGITRR